MYQDIQGLQGYSTIPGRYVGTNWSKTRQDFGPLGPGWDTPGLDQAVTKSNIHYIAKSIGSPLLMKGLTTLVISMSTNLYV